MGVRRWIGKPSSAAFQMRGGRGRSRTRETHSFAHSPSVSRPPPPPFRRHAADAQTRARSTTWMRRKALLRKPWPSAPFASLSKSVTKHWAAKK